MNCFFPFVAIVLAPVLALGQNIAVSKKEAAAIGRKVWRNECGGTVEGLTSWNAGENFASLGIGHFIWHPQGVNGPFDESFPKLLRFFESNGIKSPSWLSPEVKCP